MSVKILDVTFDAALAFKSHINEVVKSCSFHIRTIRHLRQSLTRDVANTLAYSIGSRLDYCNSLLFRTTTEPINRLQRVQKSFTRVANDINIRRLRISGSRSIDLLSDLHWLPIYKSGLQPYIPARALSSTSQRKLVIPQSGNNTTSIFVGGS